jgi:hypothetical protein
MKYKIQEELEKEIEEKEKLFNRKFTEEVADEMNARLDNGIDDYTDLECFKARLAQHKISYKQGYEDGIKIKHFFIMKDGEMRYLCNQACLISQDKVTNDYFQVTCKNCKETLVKDRIKATKQAMIKEFEKLIDEMKTNHAYWIVQNKLLEILKQKLGELK